MKKFIKNLIYFVFPIIILIIIFEIFLRNIPNDYSIKKNYLDNNSNEIEVLFLGNSHIYFGINPKYIKMNSFNASHISQSLNFDYRILEKYDGKWNKLKYIVLPIDYLSLYSTLDNGLEKWRVKNYNIYYNIYESFTLDNNFEFLNGKFKTNYDRLKNYYINDKTIITSNNLGWGTTYNSKNNQNLAESGLIASKRHSYNNDNVTIFSKNIKSIQSIIDYSKKTKIKIIFITCPAYKTYVDNLKPTQLNTTINTITAITLKNKNCKYFNFLQDKSFSNKDFYDADHLNEIGAQKLTRKINDLINNK